MMHTLGHHQFITDDRSLAAVSSATRCESICVTPDDNIAREVHHAVGRGVTKDETRIDHCIWIGAFVRGGTSPPSPPTSLH